MQLTFQTRIFVVRPNFIYANWLPAEYGQNQTMSEVLLTAEVDKRTCLSHGSDLESDRDTESAAPLLGYGRLITVVSRPPRPLIFNDDNAFF